jgi:hypothetical protein
MSYQTLEVELENGRVRAAGSETLPARAHALLTILNAPAEESVSVPAMTLGQALRDLDVTSRGEFTDLSTNKAHMDDFGR